MITFFLALLTLILGYMLYGKFVERVFGPDDRRTPALSKTDGVDYIPLPLWKIFMIQFLNIAGTGPIFGAIMGAKFGPSAYLWIVLGCIFAGATHDYLAGMLSLRNGGIGLPEIIGKYLGNRAKNIMLVFSVLLLVMVGAVFVYSPAIIMGGIVGDVVIWIVAIFVYYVIATMMPIDKIIGKIYPLFAFALLFMAGAMFVGLIIKMPQLPEIWEGIDNQNPKMGPIIPILFITIACGAISGFHATQSPLMARCMKHEKLGRPIFYGAMITEGIVALIWATVSSYFFFGGGAQDLGAETTASAPQIVTIVSQSWLGYLGGILALLGVVAAPITSGDTALRSARLIIADFIHLKQKSIRNRLLICIPLFVVTMLVLWFNIADEDGFNVIWNYFGWANQALSVFTLWALTVYLVQQRKPFYITLIPALFMTFVCSTFLLISPIAFGMGHLLSYGIGCTIILIALAWFCLWYRKNATFMQK
ncbi:MAG: carbon starvation protein A [Bacteroidaceae bacterium]|nr:carbon starvation protein A [Bacteroidaceae bacterium]